MNQIIEIAKNNPRRMFAIASSAVALIAHYVTLPVPLLLAFVAAVLGTGEVSERKVKKNAEVTE